MIQIYYIFIYLIINIRFITGFLSNNKFIYQTKIKLFNDYNYIEQLRYSQTELINWNENINRNNFYYVIGNKNLNFQLLINEMKKMNICCIFIPITLYTTKELDIIHQEFIKDKTNIKINNTKDFNNFLIFNQNTYVGELFEIYSILYENC
jgi:hypothetical protein